MREKVGIRCLPLTRPGRGFFYTRVRDSTRQVFNAQDELEGKGRRKTNVKVDLPATELHGNVDEEGEGGEAKLGGKKVKVEEESVEWRARQKEI
jgi:hypothetical protein